MLIVGNHHLLAIVILHFNLLNVDFISLHFREGEPAFTV